MCAAIGRISVHLGTKSTRTLTAIGSIGVLLLSGANFPAFAADAEKSPPIKLAVFDFELEDVSPAASLLGETTSNAADMERVDRKSTRLNSSHVSISYAVFCLKKKKKRIHLH